VNKLIKTKHWAIVVASSAFVALSYELKGLNTFGWVMPSYILAGMAAIFGTASAKFIVERLFQLQAIRKVVMGSSWIEGYWLIKTTSVENDNSPLVLPGVLFLEVNPGSGALKAVTTRYALEEGEFIVNSQVAHVQSDTENIQYLNYFKIGYPGSGVRYGMAFGEFSRNNNFTTSPNVLEGKITLEGDGIVRRQIAKRIDDEIVEELKNLHGHDWIKEVIVSDGEIAFPSSKTINNLSKL